MNEAFLDLLRYQLLSVSWPSSHGDKVHTFAAIRSIGEIRWTNDETLFGLLACFPRVLVGIQMIALSLCRHGCSADCRESKVVLNVQDAQCGAGVGLALELLGGLSDRSKVRLAVWRVRGIPATLFRLFPPPVSAPQPTPNIINLLSVVLPQLLMELRNATQSVSPTFLDPAWRCTYTFLAVRSLVFHGTLPDGAACCIDATPDARCCNSLVTLHADTSNTRNATQTPSMLLPCPPGLYMPRSYVPSVYCCRYKCINLLCCPNTPPVNQILL